jgi:hypothetical protein
VKSPRAELVALARALRDSFDCREAGWDEEEHDDDNDCWRCWAERVLRELKVRT